jgi:ABC-type amino acid transport system permease subunit
VVLGESFSPVESYTMVALLYWALTAAIAGLMRQWEGRATAYRAPTAPPAGGPTVRLRPGW